MGSIELGVPETLWQVLLAPWVISALGLLINALVPSMRLHRQVKLASGIAESLPDGPLKRAWQQEVDRSAVLLLAKRKSWRRLSLPLLGTVTGINAVISGVVIAAEDPRSSLLSGCTIALAGIGMLSYLLPALREVLRHNRLERNRLKVFYGINDDDSSLGPAYRSLFPSRPDEDLLGIRRQVRTGPKASSGDN